MRCTDIGEYPAGSFYKRGLKPLQELIQVIHYPVSLFAIDAYGHLSDDCLPGLCACLYERLSQDAIVVGVPKTVFRHTNHPIELFRGSSSRPLFITSVGIDYQRAADFVDSMPDDQRIPTLLTTVDRLSRNGEI